MEIGRKISISIMLVLRITYQPMPKDTQGRHQRKGAAREIVSQLVRTYSKAPVFSSFHVWVRSKLAKIFGNEATQYDVDKLIDAYLNSKYSSQESQHCTLSIMLVFWSFLF